MYTRYPNILGTSSLMHGRLRGCIFSAKEQTLSFVRYAVVRVSALYWVTRYCVILGNWYCTIVENMYSAISIW